MGTTIFIAIAVAINHYFLHVKEFIFYLSDIDECTLQTHTCWNDSVCVNLPGGYDCMCTSGPGCSGNCPQDEVIRRNGEDWKPTYDRCALCSCKVKLKSNIQWVVLFFVKKK